MLTQEDDVEIHALAARGWNASRIAQHTGRDRKTIRKYLKDPAQARVPAPSCLEPFCDYLAARARFVEDPHVDVTVLLRELVDAGFDRSYPTVVREIYCQWPSVSPHSRPSFLPTGGHVFSPVVATNVPTYIG